jgi:cytochrome P450 family 12
LEVYKDAGIKALVQGTGHLYRVHPIDFIQTLRVIQSLNYRTSIKYVNKTTEKIKNRPDNSDEQQTILEELLVQGMPLKDATVMVIDMLMAGIDSTANTLSFLFYFLAKNPDKQEILRKEVLSVVGPRGAPVTVQTLNELRYLKASIKESFR